MSAEYSGTDLPISVRQEKQKLRNALRQEYWKKITEPTTSTTATGDYVFDTAHQRYYSMTATRSQFFRPNYWNGFLFTCIVVAPICGIAWLFKHDRDKREFMIRSGQVAYKDRQFKLV